MLQNIAEKLLKCPECADSVHLKLDMKNKRGLSVPLNFSCDTCDWSETFHSSKQIITVRKRGAIEYGINKRETVAFREIGKGLCAIEDFCGLMNMLPPMAKSTYQDHLPELHRAYTEVAADSMSNAANELKLSDNVHDVDVSIDGTWQRRGHSSLNGVTTVISIDSGKCMDFQVLTKS